MLQGPSHADRSGCVQGPSAVRGVGYAVPARVETRANGLERVGRGSGIHCRIAPSEAHGGRGDSYRLRGTRAAACPPAPDAGAQSPDRHAGSVQVGARRPARAGQLRKEAAAGRGRRPGMSPILPIRDGHVAARRDDSPRPPENNVRTS